MNDVLDKHKHHPNFERVTLHAYVSVTGKVVHIGNIGTELFYDVWHRAPEDCDFTVVSAGSKFYAIDLNKIVVDRSAIPRIEDYTTHNDLDAAIMAAALIATQQGPSGKRYTARRYGATGPIPSGAPTGPVGSGPTGTSNMVILGKMRSKKP